MGGVPGRGFSNSGTCCVFFAWKSVIAREFLLKIDTSLAIATSGLRTNLLFENPPLRNPPHSIFLGPLVGSPQMWVWPQLVFAGSPPSPIVIGGRFPQAKPLPSPPSPSLFPPHPPSLFLQGSGRGRLRLVGGRGPRTQRGGGGGGPSSGTWLEKAGRQ